MDYKRLIHADVEQYVLGGLLFKPSEMYKLKSDDFLVDAHRELFDKMHKLQASRGELNILELKDLLTDEDKEYLGKLLILQTNVSLNDYIGYLKDRSARYAVMTSLDSHIDDDGFQKELVRLASEAFTNFDTTRTNPKLELMKDIEHKINTKGVIEGVKSHIQNLDDVVNGFEKGGLYVVAGRSGMGKSAFMTSFISNTSSKCGVISLEMTQVQIFRRVAAIKSKIEYYKLNKGYINYDTFDVVHQVVNGINNIIVDDRCGLDIFHIRNDIASMKRNGCEIIFIDHLGLIAKGNKSNLSDEVGKITAKLKEYAKDFELPIVLLCQLNREVEKQKQKKPILKDLRDSGRIEEDSDVVILLYRPSYYTDMEINTQESERIDNICNIIVAKNRHGAGGTIDCSFDKHLMYFY